MKSIHSMTQLELGAFVADQLTKAGIHIVLSGGAAVSLYCKAHYVSKDLDFVNLYPDRASKIDGCMIEMGFKKVGRYYKHADSEHVIEFPPGPLSAGDELISAFEIKKLSTGSLPVVSPTDCVKDRLAAYYHWGDLQGLSQAELVCKYQKVDMDELKRWSKHEGKLVEFKMIAGQLVPK